MASPLSCTTVVITIILFCNVVIIIIYISWSLAYHNNHYDFTFSTYYKNKLQLPQIFRRNWQGGYKDIFLNCILITCMWDSFGKNMLRRLSWAAIAKWCLLCWRLRCHYCQPFPRACRSISLFHMFHLFLQNISFWISLDRYLYINISSWSWGGLLILLPSHLKPQIQLWDYSLPPSPPWDTSSQKLKISNLPNGQLALFWCCCK